MPQVMPLRESRARAERVFVMRAVGCQPWSKIRDELGFQSVGAAQMAYRRFLARNPVPDGKTALAEIIERKRVTTGSALAALARAQAAGDHQMVATLVGVISRSDAELAKLYGLSHQNVSVDVNVTTDAAAVIAEARTRLLDIVDAEVVDAPTPTKEITR